MKYPAIPDLKQLEEELECYSQMKTERGASGVARVLSRAKKALAGSLSEITRLPDDPALAALEPDALKTIRALRPKGPRRLLERIGPDYGNRLEGALLGRMAGCTLGAPVELWSVEDMAELAAGNGDPFPPRDYWRSVPEPWKKRYDMSRRADYTRSGMNGVPVDDDIVYTLLGLLIAEEYGPDFTTADVGRVWLRYLPTACTAERVALENLKKKVPSARAGSVGNPYCELIGAAIRADPWGYMAPGWPERAAEMAYRDAFLSHRRQGIYGEMFFAAAIAAAFAVDDPAEALRIGLTEIPRDCTLSRAVRWAMRAAPRIADYRQARNAVDRKFAGMHRVHTVNNACLTVFGILIGGTDFTKVIAETVAMGLDNDCTAATAGSIVGAVVGKDGIPGHWRRNFKNTVHSYLIGKPRFSISGLTRRFTAQAKRIMEHS